jgi:hypothetical protein
MKLLEKNPVRRFNNKPKEVGRVKDDRTISVTNISVRLSRCLILMHT